MEYSNATTICMHVDHAQIIFSIMVANSPICNLWQYSLYTAKYSQKLRLVQQNHLGTMLLGNIHYIVEMPFRFSIVMHHNGVKKRIIHHIIKELGSAHVIGTEYQNLLKL